ncbi:MAG: hypothetical protein ACI849_001779 [Patiriisocius sp.]|jgi:hypothetical protein
MKIPRNIKIRARVGIERRFADISKVGHVLRNNTPTLSLYKYAV